MTTLEMIYEAGSLDGKTANFPTRDVLASRLAATAVIGVLLRPIVARSGSIFATGERFFAAPGSLLNAITAVGGRGYSRSFASADGEP